MGGMLFEEADEPGAGVGPAGIRIGPGLSAAKTWSMRHAALLFFVAPDPVLRRLGVFDVVPDLVPGQAGKVGPLVSVIGQDFQQVIFPSGFQRPPLGRPTLRIVA